MLTLRFLKQDPMLSERLQLVFIQKISEQRSLSFSRSIRNLGCRGTDACLSDRLGGCTKYSSRLVPRFVSWHSSLKAVSCPELPLFGSNIAGETSLGVNTRGRKSLWRAPITRVV